MRTTLRVLQAAALAGGLSLALAGSGWAQAQGAPPAPRADHMGPAHGWDPAGMRARMQERRQRRLQAVHDALGLRPDQDGAWRAFTAALRPPAGERGEGRMGWKGREDQAPLTTPQRLDRIEARMNARQTRFQQRAQAIRAFYATLDPRQQKTFDALLGARLMGHMRGFGPHGGMMRG